MHSREGVTQGDPLAMAAYVIEVLPLIKQLKATHIVVTEPWYAEDSGALGMYVNIKLYFNSLKHQARVVVTTTKPPNSF